MNVSEAQVSEESAQHLLSLLSTVNLEHHLQTQQVVCGQHMPLSSAAVLRPSDADIQVQPHFQPFFRHCFSHSSASVSAVLPPLFQPFFPLFQPSFCHCFSHSFATVSAPLFQQCFCHFSSHILLFTITLLHCVPRHTKYMRAQHFTARRTQQTSASDSALQHAYTELLT